MALATIHGEVYPRLNCGLQSNKPQGRWGLFDRGRVVISGRFDWFNWRGRSGGRGIKALVLIGVHIAARIKGTKRMVLIG